VLQDVMLDIGHVTHADPVFVSLEQQGVILQIFWGLVGEAVQFLIHI